MQQSRNGYYRVYFKGRFALSEKAYASSRALSFNVREDLLTSQNSSILLEAAPNAAVNGDVIILVDAYGSILYTGVIKSIESNQIDANDILTLFDDEDFYSAGSYSDKNCNTRTRYILEHYKNSNSDDPKITALINQFDISESDSYPRKWGYDYTEVHTLNVYEQLLKMHDDYSVKISVSIPINEGTPSIYTAPVEAVEHKLIDNTVVLPAMTPVVEIQETNKLIIYNQDGTAKRGVYYLTEDGITEDGSSLTRLNVVNTKIVNSDDEISTIVSGNLEKEMYNHKITVELILDNKLYDYYSFVTGGKFKISINRKYYDTVWTGYELNLDENSVLEKATMTFGKVRTKASERYFQ